MVPQLDQLALKLVLQFHPQVVVGDGEARHRVGTKKDPVVVLDIHDLNRKDLHELLKVF